MDQTLFNAARSGDVQILHQLLQQNPFLLYDYTLNSFNHDNPLTVAIKANRLAFAREIIKLNPQLALEVNPDGIRPLDVASAYGNVEIVREILALWPESCRIMGKDGRTPIHYASMNGRVEIICELLSACSDCAKDVTVFGETALHMAVKHFKFEALTSLLQWLEKLDMVEVVNWEDKEGNTVLHYAVSRKQFESVEMLIEWNKTTGNRLEVNVKNKKGLTPTDIVDILLESSTDIHLREMLQRSGAHSSSQFHVISEHPNPDNHSPAGKPKKWEDIVKHFEFKWDRDSPGEARQALLVVAALIATVTFEAGVNPPSYLFERWNETNVAVYRNGTTDPNLTREQNEIQRIGGEVATLVSITVFLVANSIALSTATSIIDYLTVGLPFQRELRVSLLAMIFAYSWSMGNTRPTGLVKDVLLGVAVCTPLILRFRSVMMSMFRGRN